MRRCPIASGAVVALLICEGQELDSKLTHNVAVKPYVVRHPQAVEDVQQQQRIFGRLSECFSLFDQQTCPAQQPPSFPAPHSL